MGMNFLVEESRFKTKDEVLMALERAGEEMVLKKKVSEKTAKTIQQPLMPRPMQIAAANYYLDRSIETGDFIFER